MDTSSISEISFIFTEASLSRASSKGILSFRFVSFLIIV